MRERRVFSKEFKMSVLHEHEAGKSTAEICRENNIHPAMLYRWEKEYRDNPKEAFGGHGNISKLDAKVAQYERVIGQLYAENAFLKKVLASLETRLHELRKQGGRN